MIRKRERLGGRKASRHNIAEFENDLLGFRAGSGRFEKEEAAKARASVIFSEEGKGKTTRKQEKTFKKSFA